MFEYILHLIFTVEGEANVIDESGEDSEEDGGGWNYYNKSTEGTEKKANIENDNNTGNNSDVKKIMIFLMSHCTNCSHIVNF